MPSQEQVQRLREAGRKRGFWNRGLDLERHAAQVFGNVDLRGKRVLEIGSGRGVFSMWAGIEGASRVVGLEPMASGFYDAQNFLAEFQNMLREVGVDNVEVDGSLVQDYNPPTASFDLVLSVHSLNHLNEEACIRLHDDADARRTYVGIFKKIRSLMVCGGKFIAIDCSKRTLISDIGVRNPFNPDIEWNKHQPSGLWAELLGQGGFGHTIIQHPGNTFCRHLRIQYVPRVVAYCMDGIFRIETTAI